MYTSPSLPDQLVMIERVRLTLDGQRINLFAVLHDVVEAAVKFEATWNPCSDRCPCNGCELARQVLRLEYALVR